MLQIGVCSCTVGMFGKCCKHQIVVPLLCSEAFSNASPVTTEARHSAAILALGDAADPVEFYIMEMTTVSSVASPLSTGT